MKKFICALFAIFFTIPILSGCEGEIYNKQIVDTVYGFNKAIISLPNGEIVEGKVQSWTDFDDSDQIQVMVDGVTYLVFSSNVALIKEDKP